MFRHPFSKDLIFQPAVSLAKRWWSYFKMTTAAAKIIIHRLLFSFQAIESSMQPMFSNRPNNIKRAICTGPVYHNESYVSFYLAHNCLWRPQDVIIEVHLQNCQGINKTYRGNKMSFLFTGSETLLQRCKLRAHPILTINVTFQRCHWFLHHLTVLSRECIQNCSFQPLLQKVNKRVNVLQ